MRSTPASALFLVFCFSSLHAQTAAAGFGAVSGGSALTRTHDEPKPPDCLIRTTEDFVPLTLSERLVHALSSVAGPSPLAFVALRAGIDTAGNRPQEWGRGAGGFGLRYGSYYAEYFISQSLEQAGAMALQEDTRYFASGEHSFFRRMAYAAGSTVLARHDNGSRSISISVLGGAAGAAFISRAWQPRSNGSAADAAVSFGLTMASRAILNEAREFSPRILGRILR